MKQLSFLFLLVITASLVEARSTSSRNEFQSSHPCPATQQSTGSCPGYIIDHIIPLDCGGPDLPSNMQWQTVPDAREKDKIERRGFSCKTRQVAPEDREYYLGPKAGCFYYSSGNKKVYVEKKWCE